MLASLGVVVLLGLTSCGTTDAAREAGDLDLAASDVRGPLAEHIDLTETTLWVGSDDMTPQILLGAITIELLESAGAEVEDQTDLGPAPLVRDSLRSGEIDLAWQGMGQTWSGFLREPTVPDSTDELFTELADRDAENGLTWLAPLTFSVGKGLAMASQSDADAVSDVPDLLTQPSNAPFCVTSDFMTFPDDGRVDFEETLDVTLSDDDLRVYDAEPIYADTASGTCLVGLVERTSGRIASYDLRVLDDDVDLFMANVPALAARAEILDDDPELELVFEVIADRLSEDELRELAERVEIDGEEPREVAADWLAEEGLTEPPG
jgi:osmoprotectant transport system substrate-binding protein